MCTCLSERELALRPTNSLYFLTGGKKEEVDGKIGVWNVFIYVFLKIEKCVCL